MRRVGDVRRFYDLLERLVQLQGRHSLSALREQTWPTRGVYFFFDEHEPRSDSGVGSRVVRVGTHALGIGSKSSLRQRLAQHRGSISGGGNHRGSIFRLLVGQALLAKSPDLRSRSWGVKSDPGTASAALGLDRTVLVSAERPVEQAVSEYLAHLTFICLDADDEPGPDSLRGYVERNSIALLSNLQRDAIDPPSDSWLGHFSDRALVRGSGLWNQRHVGDEYDPEFHDRLADLISRPGKA